MPSQLDDNKHADAVSKAVDRVRRRVHGALGTRTYRVQRIIRSWSGGALAVGTPTLDVLELDPRPLVELTNRDRHNPAAGREAVGELVITEVSLSYSLDQLQPKLAPGQECAYRIIDTGGQQQPDQWAVLAADPISRRGDRKGDNADWKLVLKNTAPMGDLDGAEP